MTNNSQDQHANYAFDFELDRFQIEAIEALERGESVLVSAPTGAGKTVIAQHLIARTLKRGKRVFYTSPIKALANQKYRDLANQFGQEKVGLLTGDLSLYSESKVVVMTTEVLRNMLYGTHGGQPSDLGAVVLDEVHYLQDPFRGPVWEEVLLLLPASVQTASLSATVSNVEEFSDWLRAIRGPTTLVTETKRPVPLQFELAVYDREKYGVERVALLSKNKLSAAAKQTDPSVEEENARGRRTRSRSRHNRRDRSERRDRTQSRRWAAPRRASLLPELIEAGKYPLIWFIFSRAGCDEAVRECQSAGLVLTDDQTAAKLGEIADQATSKLSDDDWFDLGLERWRRGFVDGLAAHHAGLIPALKDAVENAFEQGLLPVVFATETLAVGINMPARTVVVDKLIKYNGESHELLTPLQFTQLTGRAGRRGLDPVGTAVLCWSHRTLPNEMAALATSKDFPLNSAFQTNYNMVANLLKGSTQDRARDMVSRSFAQYQRDRVADRRQKDAAAKGRNVNSQRSKRYRNALVNDFDALISLSELCGFVKDRQLTELGVVLSKINSTSEAALAIGLHHGIFEDLEAAELCAAISVLIYEPRRSLRPRSFRWPSRPVRNAALELREIVNELRENEDRILRRYLTSEADPTMCSAIYDWANQGYLSDVIEASSGAGDFVRLVRQVIDLARQISKIATAPLNEIAQEAAELLDHGVVTSVKDAATGELTNPAAPIGGLTNPAAPARSGSEVAKSATEEP